MPSVGFEPTRPHRADEIVTCVCLFHHDGMSDLRSSQPHIPQIGLPFSPSIFRKIMYLNPLILPTICYLALGTRIFALNPAGWSRWSRTTVNRVKVCCITVIRYSHISLARPVRILQASERRKK